MKGIIICNSCRKKMDGVCAPCQNQKCLIKIYWQGKSYEYRRDDQGYVFTYDTAKDKLSEISTAIKKGVFNPKEFADSTVLERKFENKWNEYISEMEEFQEGGERAPEYVRVLKSYRKMHYPILEGYDVRDVDLELLAKIKKNMKGRKIKTKQNVMKALITFFNWCLKDGSLKKLPQFPEISGDDATPRAAIDYDSQIEALSRIPEKYRDIFEFEMETGIRPGESCALKVKHLDITGHKAHICQTWSGTTLRETTKQKKKQWIPMSDRAVEIAVRNAQGKHPEAWLFTNPNTGSAYNRKGLGELWNKYSQMPVTHYEATRHSFCTQLADDGVNLYLLKDLARHSDIRTTQKYVHPTDERARQAVNLRGRTNNVVSLNRTEIEPDYGKK